MTGKEFTAIYLQLGEALYRVAYYILESEADAQDAVQELFAKLWVNRDAMESVKNPKAYCITLIRNACIDRIRSKERSKTCGLIGDAIDDGSDMIQEISDKEKLKKVMSAFADLPERQRQVIQMRIFDDMSYEQISRITGMNKLTLRVLLSQARTKLKKML